MDFNAWLGNSFPLATWRDDVDPAFDTAKVIAEKPVSIVVTRAGVAQAAQTVRLEPMSTSAALRMGATAETADLSILVVGYKSHPTLADTDLRRGDRFYVVGDMSHNYLVQNVVTDVADRLLAVAEASRK